MRTGLKIWGVGAMFSVLALSACSSETIDTEMQRWCECEQEARTDESRMPECAKMIKDITRKYEFDPEAATKIRAKIIECKQ